MATSGDLKKKRSPEQISGRLSWCSPTTEMRVSHETIYQALYVRGRGALTRELTAACAPAGRCASRATGRGTRGDASRTWS